MSGSTTDFEKLSDGEGIVTVLLWSFWNDPRLFLYDKQNLGVNREMPGEFSPLLKGQTCSEFLHSC
jgi:hypothetical protein